MFLARGQRVPFLLSGAIADGLKFKEAQTSMVMADTRSGLQVAAAGGSAQKTDFNIGAVLFGAGGGGARGGRGMSTRPRSRA